MACSCFIMFREDDKMPRIGAYGDRYERDCKETLFYHENEHGVHSWSTEEVGAKEYPSKKQDLILQIFKEKFPQFCNDIFVKTVCTE